MLRKSSKYCACAHLNARVKWFFISKNILSSNMMFYILLVVSSLVLINGEECRCRCCSGSATCKPQVMPEIFVVPSCFTSGYIQCRDQCHQKYPGQCVNTNGINLPTCRGSSSTIINVMVLLFIQLVLLVLVKHWASMISNDLLWNSDEILSFKSTSCISFIFWTIWIKMNWKLNSFDVMVVCLIWIQCVKDF